MLARPKTTKAYALAPANGTVYEIEASLLTVTRRARAGNSALAMRLSRDANALWVLYRDPASLVEIPFDTLRPGRRIRLTGQPVDFDLSRETDDACIVSSSDRTISIVSLALASVRRTIQAAAEPCIARFRSDGRQLITGSQTDRSLTLYEHADREDRRAPAALHRAPRILLYRRRESICHGRRHGRGGQRLSLPHRGLGDAPGRSCARRHGRRRDQTAPGLSAGHESRRRHRDRARRRNRQAGGPGQVGRDPRQIVVTPDNEYALVLNQQSGDMA